VPTVPPSAQGALPQTGCAISGTTATCDLWAKPDKLVLPGLVNPAPIWGFSSTPDGTATAPGPVLVVDEGDTVTVTVHNGLSQNLSLAVPAMTGLLPDTDGAAPTTDKAYTFTAKRSGTYLYEAGHTANGARQAAMGLVGALVVRANAVGAMPSAYGDAASVYDDEAAMVLTEVDPALNTSADPLTFDMRGFSPKYRLINGKAFPETAVVATDVGRKVLLRYVNAGLAAHPMTTLGADQLVVGQDSRPTTYPEGAVTVPLAPGRTADALVNLPTGPDGRKFMVFESGGQLNNNGQKYGTPQVGVSPQQAFGGMMTVLDTNAPPPSGDLVGPIATRVTASPDPANVTTPVTVTADFTDAPNGGSAIDQAEVVIDDLSIAEGSGIPFTGVFGGPTVTNATATLASADLQKLTQGRHTLWVRAHDSAKNWGVVNSVTFNLSVTGAVTTGLAVTPNPTGGLDALSISATGDDTALGGTVAAAEYFIDTATADGTGTALALNQPGTAISAESGMIPVTIAGGLTEGKHTILAHTKDSLGLWGPMATVDLIVDRTGPTLLDGAVLPSITNGTNGSPSDPTDLRVNAAFTDAVATGVNTPIAGAEGFIDTGGTNGTGFTFLALDGAFNSTTENTYSLVPLTELTRLGDGPHQMMVHARDAAGNWGPLTALAFTVDRRGPVTSAVTGTVAAGVVTLTATATDALTGITAAEWYEGTDPGAGLGKPMTVTPTGATTAGLSTTIAGLSGGSHTLWVRAKDAAGNWGTPLPGTVAVTGSTLIFANNFDAGNANAWSQRVGTPLVRASAAFGGSNALTVTGRTPVYVIDNSPAAERNLHVQFGFAAGTYATTTVGSTVDLFQGRSANGNGPVVLKVQYQRASGATPQLRVAVLSGSTWAYSQWTKIGTGAVTVKLDWASAIGGSAVLSATGATSVTASGNTSGYSIESTALGMIVATGSTSGSAAIDNYTSNR
jgi:hypothetical protein